MGLTLTTAPAIEPVTLLEVKMHMRLDSLDLAQGLEAAQSIKPGAHAIAASYSLEGAGVEVLNYAVLVFLNAGTCGAGGTVDVKLQESPDDVLYTDVTGGAFGQVSEANDEAVYELAYSGVKKYLRAVATVAGATCEFALTVLKSAPQSVEDDLISGFITAARQYCEDYQNRTFITQVWDWSLDDFPESPERVPLPPLQSIDSINYYDKNDVEAVFSASNYQADTASEIGRLSLAYGKSWPSPVTLRPMNGVVIQFTAGYGAAAADVPEKTRLAIKLLAAHFYENREATDIKSHIEVPFAVQALLGLDAVIAI